LKTGFLKKQTVVGELPDDLTNKFNARVSSGNDDVDSLRLLPDGRVAANSIKVSRGENTDLIDHYRQKFFENHNQNYYL